MKVGDYIVCKSIPNDSVEGSLTIGKVYKIESVANQYNSESKVYFILADDYYPYLVLDRLLNNNFETLRDKNLGIILD